MDDPPNYCTLGDGKHSPSVPHKGDIKPAFGEIFKMLEKAQSVQR